MREYELMHERGKPPAVARVSRSVIDDVGKWLGGEEKQSNLAVSQEKPEPAYTRKEYTQMLALVAKPVQLSLDEVRGAPDRFKWLAAAGRLTPAASALQVLAGGKRDARNQAGMLAPLADIQAAQVTLQTLGDVMVAQQIWVDAFLTAMGAIDDAIALPVMDSDAAKDDGSADPPPADAVEKRDHDLMVATLKPAIQKLAGKTAGEPYRQWDPVSYTEGAELLTALGGFSIAKLKPAKDAVLRGVQAIQAFSQDLAKSVADVTAKLEAAEHKLSSSAQSYLDAPPEE